MSLPCWVPLLFPFERRAAADLAKLRQAAAFPIVSLSPSISFNEQAGYVTSSEPRDLPAEIAVLQKALTGKDTDAERYLQIGKLYQQENDPARAKQAYSKAVVFYRHRASERPKDATVLAAFGTALFGARQMVEAETVLRRAVRITPHQAAAWTALGDFLSSQAIAALLPPSFASDDVGFGFAFGMAQAGASETQRVFLAKYGQVKPTAAQIARSLALLAETSTCYDQAVASQPMSATAYLQRAGFGMSVGGVLRAMLTALQPGGTVDIATALSSAAQTANIYSSASGLSDLSEAARLAPNTFTTVGMSAMFHTISFVLHYSQTHDMTNGIPWDTLTQETQRPVQEAMRPLEQLSESAEANKETAAKASEAEGLIWMIAGNLKAAEPALRRAVALDPHRADAWDTLTGIMLQGKRYAELTSLLEARVKASDTVRNHLLLAKAYDKANQPDKVAPQIQAALKVNPEDFDANLAQAALLLQRSADPALLTEAGKQLVKIGDLYRKSPTPDHWSSYTILLSIYSGLTGSEGEARQHLNEVLRADKDNEAAKQAMTALGPDLPGPETVD